MKKLAMPLAVLSVLILLLGCVSSTKPAPVSPNAPITDVPGLPRVLLIGDSISINYTIPVRELLAGKANVHRIGTNGRATDRGVERINQWLNDGQWAVIHFNFGIWDAQHVNDKGEPDPKGARVRTPLPKYEENLNKIIDAMQATGARLIWASTTPTAPGYAAWPETVAEYNAAAARIMKARHIPIDDLNAAVAPKRAKLQLPDGCHFKPKGYDVLAKQVAKVIKAELAFKTAKEPNPRKGMGVK